MLAYEKPAVSGDSGIASLLGFGNGNGAAGSGFGV